MKHLIRSLGKGTDDTVSAVHLLISSLLEPKQQQTCKEQQTHCNNSVSCVNIGSNIMIPKISESEYQPVSINLVQLCYGFHFYSKGSEIMFQKCVAPEPSSTLLL